MNFDYQTVKLIAKTEPCDSSLSNTEDIISYCARVSNPKNQTNFSTSTKLINYCMKEKHWSIFEMVNYVFEITTTRDIGRQLLRHAFKFQEMSGRYMKYDINYSLDVIREARLQDVKNRQNSIELENKNLHIQTDFEYGQRRVWQAAITEYNNAINSGIAKECARSVLPEGLLLSRMYVNGYLRNWIHWIELREKNGTQKEHMDLALKVKDILMQQLPFLKDYFEGNK